MSCETKAGEVTCVIFCLILCSGFIEMCFFFIYLFFFFNFNFSHNNLRMFQRTELHDTDSDHKTFKNRRGCKECKQS